MSVRAEFGNFLNPMQTGEDEDSTVYCLSSGQPASDAVSIGKSAVLRVSGRGGRASIYSADLLKNRSNFISQCTNWNSKHFKRWQCGKSWHPVNKRLSSWRQKETCLDSFSCCASHMTFVSTSSSHIRLRQYYGVLQLLIDQCARQTRLICCMRWRLRAWSQSVAEKFISVIDGNALLHSVVHAPATFGDFAQLIFSCLPKSTVVHFVTDCYRQNSIKE